MPETRRPRPLILVCSFILWTSTKIVQIIALGLKIIPPQGSLVKGKLLSKTTGPIKAKFHTDFQWIGGTDICLRHLGHMTKLAAMSTLSW